MTKARSQRPEVGRQKGSGGQRTDTPYLSEDAGAHGSRAGRQRTFKVPQGHSRVFVKKYFLWKEVVWPDGIGPQPQNRLDQAKSA
jgi:hypothetical protein